MNLAQIEAVKIIGNEAIKTMAAAQGATIEQVKQAIELGNEIACAQFQKLVCAGAIAAASL
ncbi:MAG: hypothetical protein GY799_06355 [Desulfobulbaceae bacterium]|nr:hypothetical protein [Desulfobulbaceae bacterium]